jgi:cytochrome o ubiquinol oxidase operon protein cyoD
MNDANGYRRALRRYCIGLLLALLLTLLPAALVLRAGLSPTVSMASVLVLALLQIGVHLHYFLQLGRNSRDENSLIGLTVLIIALMVGGTLVIFFDQMQRM